MHNHNRMRAIGAKIVSFAIVQWHLPVVYAQVYSYAACKWRPSSVNELISKRLGQPTRDRQSRDYPRAETCDTTTVLAMAFKYMRYLLLAVLGASLFVENNYVRGGELNVVVRPTKMWRFLGMNDEMVPQRFRENVDEFSVGRIKCLRWVGNCDLRRKKVWLYIKIRFCLVLDIVSKAKLRWMMCLILFTWFGNLTRCSKWVMFC